MQGLSLWGFTVTQLYPDSYVFYCVIITAIKWAYFLAMHQKWGKNNCKFDQAIQGL